MRLALAGRRRLLGRRSALALEADRMVVDYPALLSEPLVVERGDVAVAAVDTRYREGGQTVRFPYSHPFCPGDEAETYGWMYVRGSKSPLPFLSDAQARLCGA